VVGSGIRERRSGTRDPGWIKIRIRDKHPGSATLVEDNKSDGWIKIMIRDPRDKHPGYTTIKMVDDDFLLEISENTGLKDMKRCRCIKEEVVDYKMLVETQRTPGIT
jgi:hypothetical protein